MDWFTAGIIGLVIGWMMALFISTVVLDYGSASHHEFQNICEYNGGKALGQVCVKGSSVIGTSNDGEWVETK